MYREEAGMDYSWTSLEDLRGKLVQLLEVRHAGLVTDLRLTSHGDTVVLAGEVASEGCRNDAKRLALAFDGVFKVHNRLIVAAFLEPATDDDLDDFFKSGMPGGKSDLRSVDGLVDEDGTVRGPPLSAPSSELGSPPASPTVDVTRYPMIETSGSLLAAHWVELFIDLSMTPQPAAAPLSLGNFSADWTQIEIAVQLIAPWARQTIPSTPFVVIKADGGSEPARFRCLMTSDYQPGMPAQVQAVFLHGTRICGHIMHDIATPTPAIEPREEPITRGPAAPIRSTFKVAPDAVGPDVSISILRNGDGAQSWIWKAFVPGGTVEGTGDVVLGREDKAFADGLLASCPTLEPAKFKRTMDGIGERLWDVAPTEFKTAYVDWRSRIGPSFAIQLVTDDPYVPWEMMKPRMTGVRHLFLDHPIARWPLSRAGRRRDRFAAGDLLSFVPQYAHYEALEFAIAEGRWICDTLGGTAMPADITTFLDVLDGKHADSVAMLHFAGHGSIASGISAGGIELEDGTVSVTDVHQDRVVLGKRDGTLMLLNACETAAGARLLGMNTGWGAAIADREFGGLIAPLWEVQDELALAMMQVALPPLLDGTDSLGRAVMRARAAKSDESVAAFAYLAHGDVMARFPARP